MASHPSANAGELIGQGGSRRSKDWERGKREREILTRKYGKK
jgi:hypothetical protein